MAIDINHAFVSAKADDADATLIRPSNWNADHTFTMATNKLLGRGTASAGAVEEITLGTGLSLTGTTINAGSVATVSMPQGRLTLLTATPVMTSTQSAKTTLFYTPYVGNLVPLYDGTSMAMTTFAELSAATSDTTKSPAAIGASKVNDWFVWSDAGTIRIGHGPDWTSDTARSAGTALVMVNGILLNNVSITNGPAASRGTYVGTTRSNASSQLDWILGAAAAGGTAAVLGVWNNYNKVDVITAVSSTTASWSLAAASVRMAENSASFRVSFISGFLGEAYSAQYIATAAPGAGGYCSVGVSLDTTSAITGAYVKQNSASLQAAMVGSECTSSIGWHYFQAMEISGAAGTSSFFGTVADQLRTTLTFSGRM